MTTHDAARQGDRGASAPEPSLVAREDRVSVDDRLGRTLQPEEPVPVGGDEAAGQPLVEGSPAEPSTGRVDAAEATLGRHPGEETTFAAHRERYHPPADEP